jgi:hypothetical protein
LEIGVDCGNPHSVYRTIYKGDDQPLHPEINPQALFDRLFASFTPPGADPAEAEAAAAQRKLEQKSVLDLLRGDVERLRTRVSSEEYPKIEAHLTGLRALETAINAPEPPGPGAGCRVPERPSVTGRYDNEQFPAKVAAMLGMVPHIFACDLTRVASVQLSAGFSNITHTWLGHSVAHHSMSHENVDNREGLMAIDAWYATQILDLLQALDAIDEGGSTLLDNTLVVWGREMGSTSHQMRPWPVVMFGGSQLGVRTGRYLDVKDQPSAKLLVSVCQTFGIETNNVGNIDMDSGALDGVV